jgi:hypothetical protein
LSAVVAVGAVNRTGRAT